jgi:dolichyl-phosphate mannosyltransferase polypeptide 3
MKRAVRWGLLVFVFLVSWLALLFDYPRPVPAPYKDIVPVLPLYVLVSFGCYSLAVIAYHIMTFRECPEEAKLLEKEREQAISFFKTKGIVISPKQ